MQLLFADERLTACGCDDCGGEPPIRLDPRALMSHSVRCRAMEIESWGGLDLSQTSNRLRQEMSEYDDILHSSGLPQRSICCHRARKYRNSAATARELAVAGAVSALASR